MFIISSSRRKPAIAGFVLLLITAAAAGSVTSSRPLDHSIPAVSHGLKTAVAPQAVDCSTSTTAPFYCFGAENDSTANGFTYGVYGLEGYAPNASGGVGVLGYSGKSSVSGAYGVYGVTFATNGIGVYGAGDGPTPAPGATPSSTLESTGVAGDSHSGNGVFGSTEFPNQTAIESGGAVVAGVMGIDDTTTGLQNEGVIGKTINGGFGVAGIGTDASNGSFEKYALGGVFGMATGGIGVFGASTISEGVYGSSIDDVGVLGFSTGDSGVEGISSSNAGIYGQNTSSSGSSTNGNNVGLYGYSGIGDGLYAASITGLGAFVTNNTPYHDTLVVDSEGGGAYPLFVEGSNGDLMAVDSSGNLVIKGKLTESDGSFVRTRNPRSDVMSYNSQVSEPVTEDLGTSRLVNGAASVNLAADFRQTIDGSSRYMVFLTPYGDTNGLYVASRSAAGFVVRESRGGHSSLEFDYRIVAQRYGASDGRLPHYASLHPNTGTERYSARAGGPPVKRDIAKLLALKAKSNPKLAAFERALQPRSHSAQTFVPRPNFAVEGRSR